MSPDSYSPARASAAAVAALTSAVGNQSGIERVLVRREIFDDIDLHVRELHVQLDRQDA